jgi:hypothetical protein
MSALRRQIAAYEESWKADHEAAMRCRDVEDVLAVGIMTFQLLERREQSWRDRVFRGTEDYRAEDDAATREGFDRWLATTEALLNRVAVLEQQFGSVEGAAELSRCAERARLLLAKWRAPALSAAVGLRESQLDPESAKTLQALLDRAGDAQTPPPRPLRRLPTAEASLLRKRPG